MKDNLYGSNMKPSSFWKDMVIAIYFKEVILDPLAPVHSHAKQ